MSKRIVIAKLLGYYSYNPNKPVYECYFTNRTRLPEGFNLENQSSRLFKQKSINNLEKTFKIKYK